MKTRFYLITTLALTGALLGCQREPAVNNPDYDPETETVKADLVLNISSSPAATKQTAAQTQATPSATFLGIGDGYLQPIIDAGKDNKILAADMQAADNLKLSDVLGYDAISSGTSTRRVMQVSLPLKTNKLLFYGRGVPGSDPTQSSYGSISNVTPYDAYGHLEEYVIGTNPNSCDFRLGRRLAEDNNIVTFYREENLLAGILSAIMNTRLSDIDFDADDTPSQFSTTQDIPPAYGYQLSYTFPQVGEVQQYLTWADYADINVSPYEKLIVNASNPSASTVKQSELEKKLANLYNQMTDIKTTEGELRAGSGDSMVRIIADLWSGLNQIRWATPGGKAEALAKYFADEAFRHIKAYFDATSSSGNEGSAMTGVAFKPLTDILSQIKNDASYSSLTIDTEFKFTTADGDALKTTKVNNANINLLDFPYAFHLPRGGTHVAFNETGKYFYYPKTFNVAGMNGLPQSGVTYNAESYYFPAELLYFGNGPIWTSSVGHTETQYPSNENWLTESEWASKEFDGNIVKASTKSVALKTRINYGVAMLQTQVKFDAGDDGKISDNNRAVQLRVHGESANDEENKLIPITNTSFKLTGIIIGGQPTNVGWDYLPVGEPTFDSGGNVTSYGAMKDGFIFDRAIHTDAQAIPASGSSNPNYTVVFDNFKGTMGEGGIWTPNTDQAVVNVALELQNCTGEDFFGNFNLIPDGGYFYLIGTLNPNTSGTAPEGKTLADFLDRTDGYVVPPYNADGTSQKVKRVFIQDYITKATFVIGETSLQKAYLTVPDLRSTNMSIGLSVDMSWESGLEFNSVPLGQ